MFEDALAGSQAGRAGRFGAAVGLDRVGTADALRANGADVAVGDLSELLRSWGHTCRTAAFGNADRLMVITSCAGPDARFDGRTCPPRLPRINK
jgi:hypothetical protein